MELPEERKALPSLWVYKIKRDGAGNIQRFKARVIYGGNHQIKRIDYQATYALTTHLGDIRLVLAIAAKYNLEIHQQDVCTAFFGVHSQEVMYMHPPLGYFCLLQNGRRFTNPRLTTTLRKMVLRLRNSLYALKQSLHVQYGILMDFVISFAFMALRVDGGLFKLLIRIKT